MIELKTIGVYPVSNVAGICVHEIDHCDDRVLASMNGEAPAWYSMEEQLNEDSGEYESGFRFGSLFVPFSEVMRV